MVSPQAARNIALYPWFRFFHNLIFWQGVWFLFFQDTLSAGEAILLYAIYDISVTVLEVPSGYLSDRVGRRITLLVAAAGGVAGSLLLITGDSFPAFALAQIGFGISGAFVSGTDTALLYESLAEDGRADEVEAQELRAWRFGFAALALSAVTGGAMALWSFWLPFAASALSYAAAFWLALRFAEPAAEVRSDVAQGGEWARLASLRLALSTPVLIWLFAISVLMYGFSHIPFVFGQPFILAALDGWGLAAEAPVVSGAVTSVMMLLSVAVSLVAPALRRRLGLARLLLLAFGMQIALAGLLALTGNILAIGFLFLRMVPDALSTPFIRARIQRELSNDSRATFMSLKSLVGRVLFAGSLLVAARATSEVGQMSHEELRLVLAAYAAAGGAALLALAAALVLARPPVDSG